MYAHVFIYKIHHFDTLNMSFVYVFGYVFVISSSASMLAVVYSLPKKGIDHFIPVLSLNFLC